MKSLAQLKAESKVETLLKRREKADEDRVFSQIAKEREELEARKRARTPSIKSLASFVAAGRTKEKNLKALTLRMKKNAEVVPDEGVILVVRIHVSVDAANPVKKALHSLRLDKRYSAVFVSLNPTTKKLVQIAEPFIMFGKATEDLIRKLVTKRAKIVKNGVEVELKDNSVVEEALEQYGILCIEDLIFELCNDGQHFEQASKFLAPFKLNLPAQKFKKSAFAKGGDFGFRTDINEVVTSMI
jgi:large subunit ribosomal protein L7e